MFSAPLKGRRTGFCASFGQADRRPGSQAARCPGGQVPGKHRQGRIWLFMHGGQALRDANLRPQVWALLGHIRTGRRL